MKKNDLETVLGEMDIMLVFETSGVGSIPAGPAKGGKNYEKQMEKIPTYDYYSR